MSPSLQLLNLVGAVALLLWGLRMIRTAAERALGSNLDRRLGWLGRSRPRAFLAGLGGAVVMQSSTAVVLLLSGLVSGGRLALAGALAAALGADLGSAIAARILALDIREIAPAAVLTGYVLFQLGTGKGMRNGGRALIGLGLVMLALRQVGQVAAEATHSDGLRVVVEALAADPVLAIIGGTLLVLATYSSIAVVLLVATLAQAGLLAGPAALQLVLGANLGAALPALISALSGGPAMRRLPLGNLIFRAGGVLAAAPAAAGVHRLLGGAGLGDAEIALAGHLAFNLALGLAGLPLAGAVARLVTRLQPVPPALVRPAHEPRHLDRAALANPGQALIAARREAVRLSELVHEMLDHSRAALAPGADEAPLLAMDAAEEAVDRLHNAIKFYVTELSRRPLSGEQSRQAQVIIAFVVNMEQIGDILHRNIRRLAERKRRLKVEFSPAGQTEIAEIYDRLDRVMHMTVAAFMADDEALAEEVIAQKREFRDDELQANQRHLERLRAGNEASIETSAIHLDLLRDLKRVHSHLVAIAHSILER